jgi:hypothetical protein
MNWDALGAIGDLIGGTAVMVTLIYLAIQVRQSNRVMRDTAYSEWNTQLQNLLGQYSSSESGDLVRRGSHDPDSLTEKEREQFNLLLHRSMAFYEYSWRLYKRGTLEDSMVDPALRNMMKTLQTPGGKEWWLKYPLEFSEDFTEHVEGMLGHQRSTPTQL